MDAGWVLGSRTQEALVRVGETGKEECHCQVIITRVPCGQWGLVPLGLPEKHNAFQNCPLEREEAGVLIPLAPVSIGGEFPPRTAHVYGSQRNEISGAEN